MAKNFGYLGPYRLLNVVHTGQNCQIWQAYDDANQRIVGIKTLLDRFLTDREQIKFLRWEYTVGQTLKHPLIIDVFSYAVDRRVPYLAIEWFPAPNLKQRLYGGLQNFVYLVPRLLDQAAESLGYLHKGGWVHRDVKPDNFLMNDEGQLKLIDFALARKQSSGIMKLFSGRGKAQGTRSYMSPEQIRGEPPDLRADIYSFGCMLHELFAGKPPFTGISSDDLLMKHLRAPPPPLESLYDNITPEFAQLVRKCMAKNPDARPGSMDDFLNELHMIRIFKISPRSP
ncbi:MAG: serine/threonine protein kinase, partial [Thermoguttaceae bacterium]